MPRQTQNDILREVLSELTTIKAGLPNGELALIKKQLEDLEEGQKGIRSEIRTIQKRLFNPDDGLIVEVHKNTDFREGQDKSMPMYNDIINDFKGVLTWKSNVTKALWALYSAIIGLIIKLLFWN